MAEPLLIPQSQPGEVVEWDPIRRIWISVRTLCLDNPSDRAELEEMLEPLRGGLESQKADLQAKYDTLVDQHSQLGQRFPGQAAELDKLRHAK